MTAAPSVVLRGGTVYDGGSHLDRDLVISGSLIDDDPGLATEIATTVIDVSGCSVLPGFVDLQVNGAMGVDLTTEPERIGEVAAFLPQFGVTSFMPTVISCAVDDVLRALDVMSSAQLPATAARSLGVHLEGPFLALERAGAHPLRHIRPPSLDEVAGWIVGRRPAMVTLAPELPGALDVIVELARCGVVVCAGHTAADPRQLCAAVCSGLSGVTHLFNAMGPLSARHPGSAGAALGGGGPSAELIVGLIADGLHVDPVMVTLAWNVLGPQRMALVTDCMAALGLEHGRYTIGQTAVSVGADGARTIDGVLAGSVLGMDQAVRNLMSFTGCGLASASLAASTTPARLARRPDIGRLSAGCAADVTVLDSEHRVVLTIVRGAVAFDVDGRASVSDESEQSWKS